MLPVKTHRSATCVGAFPCLLLKKKLFAWLSGERGMINEISNIPSASSQVDPSWTQLGHLYFSIWVEHAISLFFSNKQTNKNKLTPGPIGNNLPICGLTGSNASLSQINYGLRVSCWQGQLAYCKILTPLMNIICRTNRQLTVGPV